MKTTLRYNVEESDIVRASKYAEKLMHKAVAKRVPMVWLWLSLGSLMAAAVFCFGMYGKYDRTPVVDDVHWIFFPLVVGLSGFLVWLRAYADNARRVRAQSAGPFPIENVAHIDESGITFESRDASATLRWKIIRSVARLDGDVVLEASGWVTLLIPARAFASADEIEKFMAWTGTKISP